MIRLVNGIRMGLVVKKVAAGVLSQNRFKSTPASSVANYIAKETIPQQASKDQIHNAQKSLTGILKTTLTERLAHYRYVDELRYKFARHHGCKNK